MGLCKLTAYYIISYLHLSNLCLLTSCRHVDPGSGIAYHHYDQYVDGYRVLGGDIVVTVGSNHEVLSAQGHPMDKTTEFSIQPEMDESMSLLDRIVIYFSRKWSQHLDRRNIICSFWEEEIVWYRSELMHGATGHVFLAHHVDAICDFDGKLEIFEAFGKLALAFFQCIWLCVISLIF
jgi:hypothetical protein